MIPAGRSSVMSSRVEAPDSLDFFPTPPFATRALCEHVMAQIAVGPDLRECTAWEPAAGEGHMVEPLREYFGKVCASDVHDYGKGYPVGSFVGEGPDRSNWYGPPPDWIITNPPFNLALQFAERAINEARVGVAFLLRSVFIESEERYEFFERHPLTLVAPFAERVAMTKGVWNPNASTATSYAWFVWHRLQPKHNQTRLVIIPPGRKRNLTKPDDARRFGPAPEAVPLFDDDHHHLIKAVASLEA